MAIEALALRLRSLTMVADLLVGGSAAMGDYRPGVSDLDLVARSHRSVAGRELAAEGSPSTGTST